jgi:hypothetical protein
MQQLPAKQCLHRLASCTKAYQSTTPTRTKTFRLGWNLEENTCCDDCDDIFLHSQHAAQFYQSLVVPFLGSGTSSYKYRTVFGVNKIEVMRNPATLHRVSIDPSERSDTSGCTIPAATKRERMPSEVLKKKHLPALRKSSATKRRQFEPV